jgi:hypothetical protein
MKDKIPVENESGLVRDASNGAILSIDSESVKVYEERRRKILSDRQRLNKLESEMAELRTIIEELRKK